MFEGTQYYCDHVQGRSPHSGGVGGRSKVHMVGVVVIATVSGMLH